VPNFSFEQMSSCPTTWDEVNLSTGWSKYSNTTSTPDYYNSCAASNTVGIPQSYLLYQKDHRNCGAYIGLVTWTANPNEREHIGIQLIQPLVIGQKYYLSFYTVMGGTDDGTFYYESPSNNIGMRLSTVAYNPTNPAPIDNVTHLRSIPVITDTANWVRISGSIVADSAYSYLILGNFYDDANTDTTTLNCGSCQNLVSYYLIDDVCLSTDSTLCNGGIDLLPCNVSVEENELNNQVNIFPNPTNDFVTVSFKNNQNAQLILFDALGKMVLREEIINESVTKINLTSLPKGYYILKVKSDYNKQIIIKQIVKL